MAEEISMELWRIMSSVLAQWAIEDISEQGMLYAALFGGFFTLLAVILMLVIIIQRGRARRARYWPVTDGVVLHSEVRVNVDIDRTTSYNAAVSYQYTVEQRTYTHDVVAFGAKYSYGPRRVAVRTVQKYAAGTPVRVYYDPTNPQSAVLEVRAVGSCSVFLIIVVLLVTGLGGAGALLLAYS
ncbi:MAG: DUF3592 domain-containing protein [Chloroflexota bacterium]